MGLVFDRRTAELYRAWTRSQPWSTVEGAMEQLFRKMLNPLPGERVLDIGCGSGDHLLILNRLGLQLTGIDASSWMVSQARTRLGERCELHTAQAEDLPFDDNAFDLAVLVLSLEFVADPLEALREAVRVCRRRILVGTLNKLSWPGFSKTISGWTGNPLFARARIFTPWQVAVLMRRAMGPVSITWGSIQCSGALSCSTDHSRTHLSQMVQKPFAVFQAAAATLLPSVRTESLPLRARLTGAGRSLARPTSLEQLPPGRRTACHEGSTPLRAAR